nr:hypothetical protein [Chloroflexota bacterium]
MVQSRAKGIEELLLVACRSAYRHGIGSILVAAIALALLPRGRGVGAQAPLPDKFQFAIGAQAPVGQFRYPSGVAVAPDGTLYVADTGNHRVQRFSATGAFLGKWGSLGVGDGQFWYPSGVAVGCISILGQVKKPGF